MFEKSLQPMTKKLLSMLVFVCLFAANMSGQEARQRPILQVDDFIASVRANTANRAANTQAARVKSLIRDAHPTAVFQSGALNLHDGNQPVRLYTTVSQLPAIQSGVSGLSTDAIEIVTLKITSAQQLSGIDLSAFNGFSSLKYIYIASDVEVTPQSIGSALINNNGTYGIFYEHLRYE